MTFAWPILLWGLLLVPLMLLLFRWTEKRQQQRAEAFADSHLLGNLVKRPPVARRRLLTFLQLTALAALLLSAARPIATVPTRVNKAAVVIAIDASRSMLAEDAAPNRLERAQNLAKQFVEQAPASTQIGLVSFSDVASVLLSPTGDRGALLEAIERVEPARNTSLAAAVVTGVQLLPDREDLAPPAELMPEDFPAEDGVSQVEDPPPGSLLIFSDGVSNVSANPGLPGDSALDIAARFASDNEVKLYTVPVGQPGGTVTEIDGESFYVPFEPDKLERLAERGEGATFDHENDAALAELFDELDTVMRWQGVETEVSAHLSGLAVALLLAAGLMSLRLGRRVP